MHAPRFRQILQQRKLLFVPSRHRLLLQNLQSRKDLRLLPRLHPSHLPLLRRQVDRLHFHHLLDPESVPPRLTLLTIHHPRPHPPNHPPRLLQLHVSAFQLRVEVCVVQ